MKRWLLLLWLLVPLPMVVWHFGSGQKWLARDRAHALIEQAERAEARKYWAEAETLFQASATKLGNRDHVVRMQLELALARVHYHQSKALEAIDGVDRILANAQFTTLPAPQQREVRELAARIHYYAAWVMRLEGARRDLWLEQAELARQNYRLLTESSFDPGKAASSPLKESNLESSVSLERISLTELMQRPLPEEGWFMSGQGLTEALARRRGPGPDGNGPPDSGAGTNRFPGGPGS